MSIFPFLQDSRKNIFQRLLGKGRGCLPKRKTWLFSLSIILSLILTFADFLDVTSAQESPTPLTENKQILILIGPQYGLEIVEQITPAMVNAFRAEGYSLNDIFVEFLDIHRNPGPEYKLKVLELLKHKLRNKSIGLIIAVNQGAVDFVAQEGKDLLPGVPLLIPILEKEPVWEGEPRKLITISSRQDAEGTLRFALALFPDTQRVLIIMGKDDTQAPFLEPIYQAMDEMQINLASEDTSELPYEEMLARISALEPGTIALYGSYFRDVSGRSYIPTEVAAQIAKTVNTPVFAFRDMHIRQGLVGGSVAITSELGKQAVQISLDYLDGNLPLNQAVTTFKAHNFPLFDWRQIERWGGRMWELPEDTVFLNKPSTLWDDYREAVLIAAVSLVLLLFFAALVTFRNRRLEIAIMQRMRAEESLRIAEERYRRVTEICSDYAYSFRVLEDNQLLLEWVTDSFTNITGYTPQELEARGGWSQIIHPDDMPISMERANNLYSNKKDTSEFRIINKDGSFRWLRDQGEPIFDEAQGRVVRIFGAAQDITDKKAAEEKIRESEEKFHTAFNSANVGKSITKLTGEISANKAFADMLGYEQAKLAHRTWQSLTPPEEIAFIQSELAPLNDGEKDATRFIKRYICKDGSHIWADESVAIQRDPQGRPLYYITTVVDITERLRSENSVRMIADLQRQLIEVNNLNDLHQIIGESIQKLIPDSFVAISILDEESQANRIAGMFGFGKINEELVKILKIDPVNSIFPLEDMTEDDLRLLNSDKLECVPGGLYQLLLGRVSRKICAAVEKRFKIKHVFTRGLAFDGQYFGSVIIFTQSDISPYHEVIDVFMKQAAIVISRFKARLSLKESEERYRNILDVAPLGIAVHQDGNIVFSNRAGLSLLRAESPEQLVGKPITHFIHPDGLEVARARIQRMMAGEKGLYPAEDRYVRLDGQVIDVEVMASQLTYSGKPAVQVIIMDITERKHAERQIAQHTEKLEEMVVERTRDLQKAQEELIAKEKLASLGQLAGSVGHELRNPLGVINNAIYLLQSTLSSDIPKTREYAELISTQVLRSNKIISDLLNFSRESVAKKSRARVADLVQYMIDNTTPPENVSVRTRVGRGLPPVFVDQQHMEQVLTNLVSNAIQAMPHGGDLFISAARKKTEVHISVSDSGVGISPENMEKLFTPLFTTKVTGIGLGLALSKRLAEASGGRINVKSIQGEGSTFTLVLPAADSKNQ